MIPQLPIEMWVKISDWIPLDVLVSKQHVHRVLQDTVAGLMVTDEELPGVLARLHEEAMHHGTLNSDINRWRLAARPAQCQWQADAIVNFLALQRRILIPILFEPRVMRAPSWRSLPVDGNGVQWAPDALRLTALQLRMLAPLLQA